MIWCSNRKKKCFFISKFWKMTKKCLKMTFFLIKSQNIAGDGRWVSYISKCALNYDWLHGKGLILRTLENSCLGDAKNWKNGEFGEKQKKTNVLKGIRTLTPTKTQQWSRSLCLVSYWGRWKFNEQFLELIVCKICVKSIYLALF